MSQIWECPHGFEKPTANLRLIKEIFQFHFVCEIQWKKFPFLFGFGFLVFVAHCRNNFNFCRISEVCKIFCIKFFSFWVNKFSNNVLFDTVSSKVRFFDIFNAFALSNGAEVIEGEIEILVLNNKKWSHYSWFE